VSANLLSRTTIIRLRFIRGGSIHQEEPIRRMRNSVLPSDLRRFIGLPIKFVILDEFEKAKKYRSGLRKATFVQVCFTFGYAQQPEAVEAPSHVLINAASMVSSR
jgi:hypothetical protein